ncbi:MAG: Transporter substrate-binding domain-containing protein [Pseudoclavibacter caeni]|jgi:polar amino acid transport system substrate-binding protein
MNRITRRTFAALAATAVVTVALTGCASGSADSSPQSQTGATVQEIKDRGSIRIATFTDLKPYGYTKDDGTNTGFDVELGERLAQDLGVTVEWVPVNADARVDTLRSDKADLVLANFTVTDERKEVVDFAKPYMKVSIGVVSPDSALITDVSQLEGQTLAVNKGTTAEQWFTENEPGIEQSKYDSKTQQFQAFQDGRAAALADDNTYLYSWAKDNPGYTVGIKQLGDQSYIAPAVAKGNSDLLDWVNERITSLTDEGFFEQDYTDQLAPYFTSDVQPSDVVLARDELAGL